VQRIAQSFNFVSWSLSIEAFFYLAFPFLLPFVFKAPARMLLGSVALYVLLAGGAFLIGLPDTAAPNAVSYQAFLLCPILHLYEFVLGMAIAVWWKQSDQAPKAFARWSCFEAVVFGGALCLVPTLKNVSLLIVHGQTRYFLDRQLDGFLYASLFALLIYVFAFQAGALSRIFSQAWLVYLGDISFSTYMIHCIILAFFERNSSLAPLLKWPLFGLAVLCASGLLYAFLEKPSRKILVRFSDAFFKGARRPAPSLAS
jgi:peptidoglycan/LPS O-acetylase OafA/YrhL